MSMPLALFIGLQLLSLLAAGSVLFEHHQLCCLREEMFCHLSDAHIVGRRAMRRFLVGLYILTTLALGVLSFFTFILL